MNSNFILVTGAHRSGTTFLGKMLTLDNKIGYIDEPFNITHGIKGIEHWFQYIKEGSSREEYYRSLIQNLLKGKAKYRRTNYKNNGIIKNTIKKVIPSKAHLNYKVDFFNPLIHNYLVKDPIAALSSEYLHRVFGFRVIVLVRHPAAFITSLSRQMWRFNFNELTSQSELISDYINPRLQQLISQDKMDPIAEGSYLWLILYQILHTYSERNPEFIVLKHEDISLNPVKEIKNLYNILKLKYTSDIEKKIIYHTSSNLSSRGGEPSVHQLVRNSKKNIKQWKNQLSNAEIFKIRELTESVAGYYYESKDW